MGIKPEISSELRSLVRDVLREVMPDRTPSSSPPATESVRIANDGDLAVFVERVTQVATLERIKRGELRFVLAGNSEQSTGAAGAVLTGVITEQKVNGLASSGKLVLDAGAVLTPLARDKARRLGLTIERRR